MLVVLLILFTKVIADSDEDKYVDLLPDEEKQHFIENVARRILKDVESKENGKQQSGELSDEQLQKHTDYVKSILKQETENAKKNKEDLSKDRVDRDRSDEKDGLDVKPLETEKISVADDPDLDNVDLTLRNDRRGIGRNDENPSGYINVEIITDDPRIIKRSVQNDSSSDDSESGGLTSETTDKTELKTITEINEHIESTVEIIQNVNITTESLKPMELTSEASKVVESKNESSSKVVPVTKIVEQKETKSNQSKEGPSSNKSSILIESTTTDSYVGGGIGLKAPENNISSESDEDAKVKGLNTMDFGKLMDHKSTTKENNTESDITTEDAGVKSIENKSGESNSVSSADVDEFIDTPESVTTETEPTTETIIEVTTAYVNQQDIESQTNPATELATLTDEGTTDLITETSAYTSTDEILTPVETSTMPTTTEYITESTFQPAKTEEPENILEEFTSAPTVKSSVNINKINEIPTFKKPHGKIKIPTVKIRAFLTSAETTSEEDQHKISGHKVELPVMKPKRVIHDHILVNTAPKLIRRDPKPVKFNVIIDKPETNTVKKMTDSSNLYFDNNYKVKTGQEYRVYEIPTNKSAFIMDEGVMADDEPYYVPVYNYSPNHAYFNPTNRLGPNPSEAVDKEDLGTFAVPDESKMKNSNYNHPVEVKMNARTPNIDMQFSGSTFDTVRKKFGYQQKSHNMHKMPRQVSMKSTKRGHGKVNPADYVDSDYYFGRKSKYFERRVNNNHNDLFPNSNEYVHPTRSIQELSLKDHVRAVRNILFQQKVFGLVSNEERQVEPNIMRQNEEKEPYDADDVNHNFIINETDENNSKGSKSHENNIAIDYYSDKVKPIAVIKPNAANKRSNHIQKVGYLKAENVTKELYIIDEAFKENIIQYMQNLNSKNNPYAKSELTPATPFPIPTKDQVIYDIRLTDQVQLNKEIVKRLKATSKYIETPEDLKGIIKSALNAKNKISKKLIDTAEIITAKSAGSHNNGENATSEINQGANRRNDVIKVGVYLGVLKDMINLDNKALKQYDWLGTTVDIQASLQKLFQLCALAAKGDDIHPSDSEILKYVVFLHKLASQIAEANFYGAKLRQKLAQPKNKRKKSKLRSLKQKSLINRVWRHMRKEVPEGSERAALKKLNKFLMDVEDGLFDLHDAIKSVAKITKYKNQHWYQNLKELYLSTNEKNLLELLLHMTVSRLFGLIENSAKNGLEIDYVEYMKKNRGEAKKTLEELMFVMQIIDEMNKFVK